MSNDDSQRPDESNEVQDDSSPEMTVDEIAEMLIQIGRSCPGAVERHKERVISINGLNDPSEIASFAEETTLFEGIGKWCTEKGDAARAAVAKSEEEGDRKRKAKERWSNFLRVCIALAVIAIIVLALVVAGVPGKIGAQLGIAPVPASTPTSNGNGTAPSTPQTPAVKCPAGGTVITNSLKATFDTSVGGTSKPAGTGSIYTGKAKDNRCEIKTAAGEVRYTSP